jgi:uncharacterized membrane protein
MRCANCHQENDDLNSFCTGCGVALAPGPDEGGGLDQEVEAASPDALAEHTDLADLHGQVRSLQQEVQLIRTALVGFFDSSSQPAAREAGRILLEGRPSPTSRGARPDSRQPGSRLGETPAPVPPGPSGVPASAAAGVTPPPAGPRYAVPWERFPADWELLLGGNWLARIGVLAVVIGMGFFLKLAFDNNWIGETGRVGLGIVGGVAFLAGGEYWHKRYPAYAQALAGGGVALLYLSIFAAFAIFGLISLYPAVGMLLLISVASAAIAVRYESVALAVIGILGAFMAPFVTGGFAQTSEEVVRAGSSIQLMAYVMAVDVGVLALSTFRNWRWFTLLALLGSLATFGMWYDDYGSTVGVLTSQGSLTIVFLIFVAATTLFHIVWRRAPQAFDQSLMVINAAAFFGISYGLLWDDFRPWMGGFTLLLALFYGALAYLALVRSREHVHLSLMALGIALVFLTIAVPVQLGGPWVSVAWAVEGVVLVWLSFTLRMWQLRVFSVGVFAVFAAWLIILDTPDALSADVTPFLNSYLLAFVLSIAATYLAAYLVRRNSEDRQEWDSVLFPAFLSAGNVFLTLTVPTQVDGVWIAVSWAVEAAALMWLSFRLGLYELRLFSLGVFGTLAVRLLVFDTPVDLADFRIFLNFRVLAFGSGIIALYVAAFLVRRGREAVEEWEPDVVFPALLAGASFLTLWVASAEVISAVDSGIVRATGQTADHVKSLSLSLLWAAYGGVVLALGIVRGWRTVRVAGLALLAVPVLKLFLWDSVALERGYRVAAFMALGGILLVGGFLYQRYSAAFKGFLFEDQDEEPKIPAQP